MAGLWADGWFYISSAGLFVSGVLFFFLLGQYRAASEAADVTASERPTSGPSLSEQPVAVVATAVLGTAVVSPVFVREEPAAAPIASMTVDKPAQEPETKPEPERRKYSTVTTGGLSPAVVYLQNIKAELAELHQEMRALAKRVDVELGGVSARDEALIERLGELARVVEKMPKAAPEPAEDQTPRMELSAAVDTQLAQEERPTQAPPTQSVASEPMGSASAPAAAPPEPEDSSNEDKTLRGKPRRGPVWPV